MRAATPFGTGPPIVKSIVTDKGIIFVWIVTLHQLYVVYCCIFYILLNRMLNALAPLKFIQSPNVKANFILTKPFLIPAMYSTYMDCS